MPRFNDREEYERWKAGRIGDAPGPAKRKSEGGEDLGMTKWEYRFMIVHLEGTPKDDYANLRISEQDLNHLGSEGWEAVGLIRKMVGDHQDHCAHVLLKRPAVN